MYPAFPDDERQIAPARAVRTQFDDGSFTLRSPMALQFYAHIGKCPSQVRREIKGHIANRLQAALWREAFHLVDQGVATVEDIDTAISQGPWLAVGADGAVHEPAPVGRRRWHCPPAGPPG